MADLINARTNEGLFKYFEDFENNSELKRLVEIRLRRVENNWLPLFVLDAVKAESNFFPLIVLNGNDKGHLLVQFLDEPLTDPIYVSAKQFENQNLGTGSIFFVPKQSDRESLAQTRDPLNQDKYQNIKKYYGMYRALASLADPNMQEICYYAIAESTRVMLDNYVKENFTQSFYNTVADDLAEEKINQILQSDTSIDEYCLRMDDAFKKIDREKNLPQHTQTVNFVDQETKNKELSN